jgi:hypothetical protein
MAGIGNNFVAAILSAIDVDIYFACIRRPYYTYNKDTLTTIEFITSVWPGSG